MWLHFAIFLLVGAAWAEHDHGWKKGQEYQYLVRTRTLTSLGNNYERQYAGILVKAILTVQVTSPDLIQAVFSEPQYARLHKVLPKGWESYIPDQELHLTDFPLSRKPFEVKLKHGLIRDLKVANDVPNWELNFIKSVFSQLQLDTMGENAIKTENTQIPSDHKPFAMFRAMEDSIGGRCEVLYDMTPFSDFEIQNKPEMIPMPHLRGDGNNIEIIKTRNYSNCEEQVGYRFGITKWPVNHEDIFILRSTASRAVISGKLAKFTIQSSVSKNRIFSRPTVNKHEGSMVASKVNLTLANINLDWKPVELPDNLESIGNLVYRYDNPFLDFENTRHPNFYIERLRQSSESSREERNQFNWRNRRNSNERDSTSESSEMENESSKARASQPLDTPLTPYMSTHKDTVDSQTIDVIGNILNKIVDDLDNPSDMPTEQTLETFSIFVSIIRTMNSTKILALERILQLSNNNVRHRDPRKVDMLKVLRDTVGQAGTGSALIVITKWLNEKKFEDLEAALLVSKLARSVRTPTPEYLKGIFELVKKLEKSKQLFSRDVAPVVFGELIRHSGNRNYVTHNIKSLKQREDPAIVDVYIPHLQEQLEKAVKEGNGPQILTYTRALGYTGHQKILSIFEPYLEGKRSISTLQRTIMVASFNRIVQTHPTLARSILYKIYLNKLEAHEVRCAAVFLLMRAKPSLGMMHRMAESTNYDTDKNVNSAIKSSIENAAKSTLPEDRTLAYNARVVRKLLTPKKYGDRYSKNRQRVVFTAEDIGYKFLLNTIGSEDTDLPKGLHSSLDVHSGGFHPPETQVGYVTSSIKQLLDFVQRKLEEETSEKSSTKKDLVEDLARKLSIQPEDSQQVEGNVYLNSMFGMQFYSFDNHTLDKLIDVLKGYLLPLREKQDTNINLFDSYDLTQGFPTETGLPFIFSLKQTRLMRLKGKNQVNIGMFDGSKTTNLELSAKTVLATKTQGRMGFITPFEEQHYLAGIDIYFQLYIPSEIKMELDFEKQDFKLELRPLADKDVIRLLHYSVTPYTWAGSVYNVRPLSLTKSMHRIGAEKPRKMSLATESLEIKMEDDIPELSKDLEYSDYWETITKSLTGRDFRYQKFDVYWNLDKQKNDWTVIKATYDKARIDDWKSQESSKTIKAPVIIDKKQDSKTRRKQMIQEANKMVDSGIVHVLDVSVDTPNKKKGVLTVGMVNNQLEEKVHGLFYGNIQSEDEEIISEACAAAQIRSDRTLSGLDIEKTLRNVPKKEFTLQMTFGDCANGEKLNVEGKQIQTADMRDAIKNSKILKRCWEEMKEGNKGLRACQEANAFAEIQNQLELTMDIESEYLSLAALDAIKYAKGSTTTSFALNPKNTEKNVLAMKMHLSPDMKSGDISVSNPIMNFTIPYSFSPRCLMASSGILSNMHQFNVMEENEESQADGEDQTDEDTCTLDINTAYTFDDRLYPVKLGRCWHVMMTTSPQQNPDNPHELIPIPRKMRIAVLARETKDNWKEIKVITGNKEIKLQRATESDQLEATIEEKPTKLWKNKMIRVNEENGPAINIMLLSDESIKVATDDNDLSVVFDGKRVRIQASPEFRNTIRGLCGNYDRQADNDFLTPKRCIVARPEEFVATFALTQDDCQGWAPEHRIKAEQSQCVERVERQSNVISDLEAGRSTEEMKKWGYHTDKARPEERSCTAYRTKIIEHNGQICFSTRPVPWCVQGCTATETKPKKYSFHCMSKTETAIQMKDRIEQGANPDMSRRTASVTEGVEVPVACSAA